jgi:hypothetical protein
LHNPKNMSMTLFTMKSERQRMTSESQKKPIYSDKNRQSDRNITALLLGGPPIGVAVSENEI